jgi:hypothetical protein
MSRSPKYRKPQAMSRLRTIPPRKEAAILGAIFVRLLVKCPASHAFERSGLVVWRGFGSRAGKAAVSLSGKRSGTAEAVPRG